MSTFLGLLECQQNQYLAAEMEDFQKLLLRLAGKFPSRDAFARALGINGSRLSRALNTGDFPFNVSNCLRLAKISGEPPGDVLRAAGKGDIADLIESLYGAESEFTGQEKDLIAAWRKASPRAQQAVADLIEQLVPASKREEKQRRKTA